MHKRISASKFMIFQCLWRAVLFLFINKVSRQRKQFAKQRWECLSSFLRLFLDGIKLIEFRCSTAIGNQYGQFLARSKHKSQRCSIMQFICNWISRDMRSGWCVDRKILFHCCFFRGTGIFSSDRLRLHLVLRATRKKNSCWCCVTFTVRVLHFQRDDEFAELLFTCSWQIWNRCWRV